jgi:DNA-binding SARP family transcriptional activator/predicted ATPase
MAGDLELRLLGKPEIRRDGQPVTELAPVKGQALLYFLAVDRQAHTRPALATLLWGEMPEETARTNLRLTLSRLRREVGDALIADRQMVALDLGLVRRIDVAEFEAAALSTDPAALCRAAALYRGNLLDGFGVRDAPEFEHWLAQSRERLQRSALATLERLVVQAREAGHLEEGIGYAQRMVGLAPWLEEAHRHLMWLLAQNGQRSAALAQFEACRQALAEELNAEPSAATLTLYEQIRAGALAETGAAAALSPAASTANRGALLPAAPPETSAPVLTQLVGREQELGQIAARLADPACRLLTLVGPGGIGKTRLALAALAAEADRFRDGGHLVGLVGVKPARPGEAPELVVAHLANALEFTFTAQQPPRELLLYHLHKQEMLLVLDNFEQLLEGVVLLAEILREAPGVKLLVTSRTRLGLAGEWVLDVGGLSWGATPAPGALAVYPATRLFVECARRIQPGFQADVEAAAIHQICAFVEGSPLCIELAANWVRVLPCAEIAERLTRALDLLEVDSPIVAPRHQSLRAVLDGSWALLTLDEQGTFARLSIFDGGFTLAAAEAVAGAGLPVLARLVEQSWLQRDMGGRFRVHELLRQFAADKLAALPITQAATAQRHATYFAGLLRRQAAALPAVADDAIWTELDPEMDNFRRAWRWLAEQGAPDSVAGYLDGLWLIYRSKGWHQEAVAVLEQACARLDSAPLLQARWRRRLAEAHYQMGDLEQSRRAAQAALVQLGNPLPTGESGWQRYLLGQIVRQGIHRLLPVRWIKRSPGQRETAREIVAAFGPLGPTFYQKQQPISLFASSLTILNVAERAALVDEGSYGLATVALALGNLPAHRLARFYSTLAWQHSSKVQNRRIKASALQALGLFKLGLAEWSMARQCLSISRESVSRDEAPRLWEENTTLLGILENFVGNESAGMAALRDVYNSAAYRGDAVPQLWGLVGQAEAALYLGRTEHARKWIEAARHLPEKQFTTSDLARLHAADALALLRQQQHREARQAVERALQWIVRSRMQAPYTVYAYQFTAEVYLAPSADGSGDIDESAARQACGYLDAFARLYRLAQPYAWQVRGVCAWRARRPARALRAWQQALKTARALAIPYEQGRAHALLGRHLRLGGEASQAAEHLDAARALFTRLDARHDLATLD